MEAILAARPLARRRAARLLRLPEPEACRLLVALAALHDLGKFAPAFQAKVPEMWPSRVLGPLDQARLLQGGHTADGYELWTDEVGGIGAWATERLWPGAEGALHAITPAIFGHHGRPALRAPGGVRQRFGRPALATARECATALLDLLAPRPLETAPPDRWDARIASWWIAGLMTTADWIGSGTRWFEYAAPLDDDPLLERYWERARGVANKAVMETGLAAPAASARRAFVDLIPGILSPTPVQRWTDTIVLPDGPCLIVIEDVTGAGKTEAAQVLVHRLMTDGRIVGAYWAMPTQATANAMYGRQADSFGRLYVDGASPRPSLVLAHGKQAFHEAFRSTVLPGATEGAVFSALVAASLDADSENGTNTGTASCAAFLADDQRKALLADVGAGTIDQAILGILPSRFNTIRLLGLADKVLVVDEAHAYDRYMGIEIEELLRFQAALGGCAVVLSATLPLQRRLELVQAWMHGLKKGGWTSREPQEQRLSTDAYPLATVVAGSGITEAALDTAPWSERTVEVRLLHTVEDAARHVQEMASAGGAVAWVRNTVDDCLQAAALLRDAGCEKVMVFHARFAQADRQSIEKEVLRRFGKDASIEQRRGWVLMATQVVEQSLDLDFDAMVSDLAPIDLLIQRAGRLQRHTARDATRPALCRRELVVLSPPREPNPSPDWPDSPFKGSSAVYRHVGVLWRTASLLAEVGKIQTPGGLRFLIERVYGSDEVPESLQKRSNEAEGREAGSAATALYGTLKVDDGYDGTRHAWLNELRVPTRIGDENVPIRVARVLGDGTLAPWADGVGSGWKAWALSEVRVHAYRAPPGTASSPQYAAAVDAVRSQWGKYEQDIPVLALTPAVDDQQTLTGTLVSPKGTSIQVEYSAQRGLFFPK